MNDFETNPRKKHSSATPIAVLALILTLLMGAGFAGGLFFVQEQYRAKTDEIKSDYETRLASLDAAYDEKIASLQGSLHTDGASLSDAEVTIDKTSAAVVAVAEAAKASVVCITVTVPPSRVSNGFFWYETESSVSMGSGIIYNEEGYILTNRHVVESALTDSNAYLSVILDDGTELSAALVAADSQTDIAVIRVEDAQGVALKPATFGSSQDLKIGEMVIAIGNPLGIEYANSVTVGFVSGLNRQVSGENGVESMIQTDAAINPGNSGGALLNSAGQVIGVNTAKIASTDVEGIGFAIPIDTALQIARDLIQYGYVKDRPATGISDGIEITQAISRRYNLPIGFYVSSVASGSAAALAGIRQGDVILSFDGQSVTTLAEIEALKREHRVGDTVAVEFSRNGTTQTVRLTLTEDKG